MPEDSRRNPRPPGQVGGIGIVGLITSLARGAFMGFHSTRERHVAGDADQGFKQRAAAADTTRVTSGPTQMDHAAASRTRWQGHPWLARLVRVAIALVPITLSVTLSLVAARIVPPYRLGINKWLWWLLVGLVSTAVLVVVDRVVRRLLPLTALLRMTLIFPDDAPSRFRLAMRTGTTKQLERFVEESRAMGATDTTADRATTMLELVAALSVHDRLTRGHCERVRAYTDLIINEMRVPETDANLLRWAALLHDVGKLRVPREILASDQRPTATEWEVLTTHPAEGMALTNSLADWLGEWRRTIGEHHERWDGNGYPNRLPSSDIHLGARIVAVADAFDVMTSVRSYKKPIPAAVAREEIARCSGTQFDPAVVRAFLNVGLRRLQFALGPLSWISNLPFVGQAPIMAAASNAIGGLATASLLAVAAAGTHPPVHESTLRPPPVVDATVLATTGTSPAVAPADQSSAPRFETFEGSQSAEATTHISLGSTTTTTSTTSTTQPVTMETSPVITAEATTAPAATGTIPPMLAPVTTLSGSSPTTHPAPSTATTALATTTTHPAVTTTTPPPGTQTFFLSAAGSLTSSAPAVANPEPDLDVDGKPGLTVTKDFLSGVAWVAQLDTDLHLRGPVTVDLFSTVKNFANDQVTLTVELRSCDGAGTNCVSLLVRPWTFKPWNVGGAATWTERQLLLGSVDTTVPAGSQLCLALSVADHDLWVALSGDRPSSLQLPV